MSLINSLCKPWIYQFNFISHLGNFIHTEIQRGQIGQVAENSIDSLDLIVTQAQILQLRKVRETILGDIR